MDVDWKLFKDFDLTTVKLKFLSRKSIFWKLRHNADKIENEYRQFLYLIAKNPGKVIVPWSQNLDDFWHEHILDTAKYRTDCENLIGRFIDHNPHLPKGTKAHTLASSETETLYRDSFETKAKFRERATSNANIDSAGCSVAFIPVFCGSSDYTHHSHSDCGSHSCSSDTSAHCGSSHSCGGHSCSSCGSSCGGGGD